MVLEESGLSYEVVPIDTRTGEQFSQEFTAINPNSKTPALPDDAVRVFDSNAILLCLAQKTGKFLPENALAARGELLSWMMFIASGMGPYSGQAVHFQHFAPRGLDYAVDRYLFEANRHYGILDAQLAKRPIPARYHVHYRGYVGLGDGYGCCRSASVTRHGACFRRDGRRGAPAYVSARGGKLVS
jgi:glutathione S-transferase